jgi:uncharacterized NAD-dependent epimerase/dehydratase family protein
MGTNRPTAVVYCEGAFRTTNGKTAHGLLRRSLRYHILCVVDSTCAGSDSGEVLEGRPNGIPILSGLEEALDLGRKTGKRPQVFVIGIAPEGGRLDPTTKTAVLEAIRHKLDVHSGLHDFLTEDQDITDLAIAQGVTLLDIRKPPPRNQLHFFSGKIEQVSSFRIAVLGTDSAVGKRTTAWLLHDTLRDRGYRCELIGTGQTAWLQGARYGIVLDALVNDFVSGEIEHAVWKAWKETAADILIIEGQGSLLNPAYPGGFEILAAARPHAIVLQHAPGRKDYDGFPGYPIHPLPLQIELLEKLSGKRIIAVTINHENLPAEEIATICRTIEQTVGVPTLDPLLQGTGRLADVVLSHYRRQKQTS